MTEQNRTGTTIADLLWNLDRSRDTHPAVVERGEAICYGELRARAGAVAEALRQAGVSAGDRVGVLLPRGAEATAVLFGVAALGGICVCISERLRTRQIEYILEHSGAETLISSKAILGRLPRPLQAAGSVLNIEDVPLSAEFQPKLRRAEDPAQIIYTSGSTGMPKGVVHGHGSLLAGVVSVIDYLGLEPDDRVASLLPFSSVYGLNQLLCSVALGSTLIVDHSPLANDVANNLVEERVTVLAAVPPLWLQLLRAPAFAEQPIPSLRILQNAGGHLPVPSVRALRDAQPHADLFLMYGQTETFRGSYLPPDFLDERPNSIGHAIPGSDIFVLDDDLRPCAPGEVGELVQRGPAIALGYWNDNAATDRVFRSGLTTIPGVGPGDRLVFTGDLVRRDEDGFLYFVSRKDHLIKTLGFRVGPDEILDVLHASAQIREGVITTETDDVRGERIVASVVLSESGSLAQLTRFARMELPPHMMPARFDVHDRLPRMPGGKYDMAAVRELAASSRGGTRPIPVSG